MDVRANDHAPDGEPPRPGATQVLVVRAEKTGLMQLQVGLSLKLEAVKAAVAASIAGKSDEEIAGALLSQLGITGLAVNCLPPGGHPPGAAAGGPSDPRRPILLPDGPIPPAIADRLLGRRPRG